MKTALKTALLTGISGFLVTDIAFAIELAGVCEVFLYRSSKEALAALTSHGSIVEASGLIATHDTSRGDIARIHITRKVRCS